MSEKRPADVFIQAELEVVLQVAQSSVQDFRLVTENTHVTQLLLLKSYTKYKETE